MNIQDTLKISTAFSPKPGARYIEDGDNSGQAFLERLLLPKFKEAVTGNYILEIDLEDLFGFPASFVSGSFGKLSQSKGAELVLKHIVFKSEDNPLRAEKALREIKHPSKLSRDDA